MRKVSILAFFIFLAIAVFAQGFNAESDTVSPRIADSGFMISNPPGMDINEINSVYDIYWVTNSIKSGWKSADTTLAGCGIEPCDSVHPFIMPVDGKFWRGCTYYHAGWDVGCDYGTPVKAALGGKVRFANYCSGYGKLVIVRHYSGMEVYYAHLSKILVSTDHWVDAGDTIGLVGATGRARGNHLHMEFRLNDRALDIADYYVHNDTIVNLYKIFDPPDKPTPSHSVEYHTVVRGDNLWDISRNYGTTVSNLCSLNQISKNSTLRIGQKLKVK